MEPFPASLFIRLSHVAGHYYPGFIEFTIPDKKHWDVNDVITEEDRTIFDRLYGEIKEMCDRLELFASAATISKMRACLERKDSKYGDFFAFGEELHGRLVDETESGLFLKLTPAETEYFERPTKTWTGVTAKFASAIFDIEESAKCLAFHRGTAAVFHLMRCMEIALRATARCLAVSDPTKPAERNWGAVLAYSKDGDRRSKQGNASLG